MIRSSRRAREPPVKLQHERVEPAIDPRELFLHLPELLAHSGELSIQDRAQVFAVGWGHIVYLHQPPQPFKRIGQDTWGAAQVSEARTGASKLWIRFR